MTSAAPFPVLYEDNHLLVIVKPPGIPTMGVAAGKPSLIEVAREYIRRKYHKPGNVYLGVVSRLDAPVSGALVFARTSKAAARLTEQFREHRVEKTYWAVVTGNVQPPTATLVDFLAEHPRHRRMDATPADTPGAKEARLRYQVLRKVAGRTLVEVELETGRKHQIRAQLAQRGFPIVGDRKYGSSEPFGVGIALHGRRLALEHPVRGERLEFLAPLPPSWRKLGISES